VKKPEYEQSEVIQQIEPTTCTDAEDIEFEVDVWITSKYGQAIVRPELIANMYA
jgi:hypothetical protein